MESAVVHRDRLSGHWDFFLSIPELGPLPPAARLGEGLAGSPAALRVLGGLCRLRRDAVPEAGQPAVRGPHARGQRHRLLVDLRRQPADDAVGDQCRRARAGLGQLAVRGQRRIRARHPARSRGPAGGLAPCSLAAPRKWARSWPLPSSMPIRTRRRPCSRSAASRRARTMCWPAALEPGGDVAPGAAPPRHWPTLSSARACGSSAVTAGPTTSASAAWTTSWLGAQRQRPGTRHRGLLEHRRPGVQGHPAGGGGEVRGRRQGVAQERPGARGRSYGNVYVAQVAMGANDVQASRRYWRPRPIRALR